MKGILVKLYRILSFLGINPILGFRNLKGLKWIQNDKKAFKKICEVNNYFEFPLKNYPVATDKYDKSGVMSGHYFHHDLLIASKIFKAKPKKHVDIGSRIDGFVAHVASFREIELVDIRPNKSNSENINFIQLNAMDSLEEKYKEYTDSVSSLNAIEHFGLGRYGDPIDCFGHLKGIRTAKDFLTKNGIFYFAVPIGSQRVEFNAHRVFSLRYLLDILLEDFWIKAFDYVDDKGDLNRNVKLSEENIINNCNCEFGCGIFELQKK